MFNTLYILQWDNYYDRRVHPALSETENGGLGYYLEFDTASFTGVNFNPNDHINTEIILNLNETQLGNYLIVLDENNSIVSRWFITEAIRVRGNQYKLSLHRDVITDYWNIIKNAPSLIEKCNLDYDNPLIFNSEDMTVNQIKTNETLLKDRTGCPWLVAYIAKDAEDGLSGTVKVDISDRTEGDIRAIGKPINEWLAEYGTYYGDYIAINYDINVSQDVGGFTVNGITGEGKTASLSSMGYSTLYFNYNSGFTVPELGRKTGEVFRAYGLNNLKDLLNAYTPERNTTAAVEEYLSYQNKLIEDSNGEVYRVSIKEVATQSFTYKVSAGSLYNALTNICLNQKISNNQGKLVSLYIEQPNDKTFRVRCSYNTYKLTVERQTSMEVNYSIGAVGARASTRDAQYDIIALPYGEITVNIAGQSTPFTTTKELGIATIQAIAKNMDAGCYDIQLVPYCPVSSLLTDDGTFLVSDTLQYSLITQDSNPAGIIFNVPAANFTTNLFYSVPAATSSIGRKVNNDCDKWRLCSPNYSNYFDFSIEKNNGVQYFNVDCCYKPYTPYIHINPNFNGLYGQDFNDPRGLVCGGDFSLTQVRDAWENYQLQNKNFQATFDRQIQNMEITNKYQKALDITSAIAGTIQGGVSGGSTGAFASGMNPYAAIGGAAVGGIFSAGGGIADVVINEKLRNEALDYTKDQFGYQLGNIQAIPLTLTKVDAFNDNNKIFPVLEYYTCTNREKEAYAYKIAYNGMTNMTIGAIEDYLSNYWEYEVNNKIIKSQSYIKAKPIHLLMNDDFHMANTIAKEMNMGFYIVEEE